MPKYTVRGTTQYSGGARVDANTPAEARAQVLNEGFPGFCAGCAGWGKSWYREEDDWKVTSVENALGNTVWEWKVTSVEDARGNTIKVTSVEDARGNTVWKAGQE